jgi:hypothetical protein
MTQPAEPDIPISSPEVTNRPTPTVPENAIPIPRTALGELWSQWDAEEKKLTSEVLPHELPIQSILSEEIFGNLHRRITENASSTIPSCMLVSMERIVCDILSKCSHFFHFAVCGCGCVVKSYGVLAFCSGSKGPKRGGEAH